jgi:glucan phosphoethanolaminetransferase (alkaline phosphatase superfamily)
MQNMATSKMYPVVRAALSVALVSWFMVLRFEVFYVVLFVDSDRGLFFSAVVLGKFNKSISAKIFKRKSSELPHTKASKQIPVQTNTVSARFIKEKQNPLSSTTNAQRTTATKSLRIIL